MVNVDPVCAGGGCAVAAHAKRTPGGRDVYVVQHPRDPNDSFFAIASLVSWNPTAGTGRLVTPISSDLTYAVAGDGGAPIFFTADAKHLFLTTETGGNDLIQELYVFDADNPAGLIPIDPSSTFGGGTVTLKDVNGDGLLDMVAMTNDEIPDHADGGEVTSTWLFGANGKVTTSCVHDFRDGHVTHGAGTGADGTECA